MEQRMNNDMFVREVLLSTWELTYEAVILYDNQKFYESSPVGKTLGFKETQSGPVFFDLQRSLNLGELSQMAFDAQIVDVSSSQISTAFSLAYLKLLSYCAWYQSTELSQYLSSFYKKEISSPKVVSNILNGWKHANNQLSFCEFMIIPLGDDIEENIKILSEVYLDLWSNIVNNLRQDLYIGREGGFAPSLSDNKEAIDLIIQSINRRHKWWCWIAIDVAANNFSYQEGDEFFYKVDGITYSSEQMVKYYIDLIELYPYILYLEDPFHEEDIRWRRKLYSILGDKILIVADDLTITKKKNIETFHGLFNACILKLNQAGSFSEFIKSYNFCESNGIKTIVSQRSGETDSNVISHIAVGLGADYLKAGAPARERIIKYNELLHIID